MDSGLTLSVCGRDRERLPAESGISATGTPLEETSSSNLQVVVRASHASEPKINSTSNKMKVRSAPTARQVGRSGFRTTRTSFEYMSSTKVFGRRPYYVDSRISAGQSGVFCNGVRASIDPSFWEGIKFKPITKLREEYFRRSEGDRRDVLIFSKHRSVSTTSIPTCSHGWVSPDEVFVFPDIDSLPFGDFPYKGLRKRDILKASSLDRRKEGFSYLAEKLMVGKIGKDKLKRLWNSVSGSKSERVRKVSALWHDKEGDFVRPSFSSSSTSAGLGKVKSTLTKLHRSKANPRTVAYLREKLVSEASLVSENSFFSIASAVAPEFVVKSERVLNFKPPRGFPGVGPPPRLVRQEAVGTIVCNLTQEWFDLEYQGGGISSRYHMEEEEESFCSDNPPSVFNMPNDGTGSITNSYIRRAVEYQQGCKRVFDLAKAFLRSAHVYESFMMHFDTVLYTRRPSVEVFLHMYLAGLRVVEQHCHLPITTPEERSHVDSLVRRALANEVTPSSPVGVGEDSFEYRPPASHPPAFKFTTANFIGGWTANASACVSKACSSTEPIFQFDMLLRQAFKAVTGQDLTCSWSDIVHLYHVITTLDPVARFLSATALLGSKLVNDLVKFIGWNLSNVSAFCMRMDPEREFQSFDVFSNFLKRVRNADIFKQGGIVLLSGLALGLFDNPVMAYIASSAAVTSFMGAFNTGGIVVELLAAGAKMLERILKFSQTLDINDLFPDNSNEAVLLQGESIKEELNLVGMSNFDPNPALAHAWDYCLRYSGFTDPLIRKTVMDITTTRDSLLRKLSQERACPLGIIVVGGPGSGKTTFCKQFARMVEVAEGVPFGVNGVFEFNTTDHQDVPPVVAVTIVNDYFSIKAESKLAKEDPITFLQSLIDIFSMKVSSAAIEDKRRSYLNHAVALVSTNAKTYVCSQSSSGVTKLDRRYWIASIDYDVARIEKDGMTMKQFAGKVAIEGYSFTKKYLVYKIGKMNNIDDDTKTIHLKPRVGTKTFTTYESFFDAMKEIYDEHRKDRFIPSATCSGCRKKLAKLDDPCDCSLFKTKRNVAPLMATPEAMKQGMVAAMMQKIEEGITTKPDGSTTFSPDDTVLLGSMPSMMVSVPDGDDKAAVLDFMNSASNCMDHGFEHRVEVPFLDRFLGGETMLSAATKLALVTTGLYTAIQIVSLLARWFRPYDTSHQGSIASVSNLVREHVPVENFRKKNVEKWMNAGSVCDGWVPIHNNTDCIHMHAVLLTTRCLMTPSHLFTKNAPGLYKGPRLQMSIDFGGEYPSQDFTIERGQMWFSDPVNGDGFAIIFFPVLRYPLVELFSRLHNGTAPVGPLRVGDKECPLLSSSTRELTYEADLGPGSCGLPIVDSRGVFYGLHHAVRKFVTTPAGGKVSIGMVFQEQLFEKARLELTAAGCVLDSSQSVESVKLSMTLEGEGRPHDASDVAKLIKFKGAQQVLGSRHLPLGWTKRVNVSKVTVRQTMLYEVVKDKVGIMGAPHTGKAILVAGEWASPDLYRLQNMRVTSNYQHEACHKAALDYLQRFDFQPFIANPVGPVTLYQSLTGDPRNAAMNPKDPSKSIGDTLKSLGYSKEQVFKFLEPGRYEVHQALLDQIDALDKHLWSEDPLEPPVVVATIKDEPYPLEKVKAGKGRYFYVLDVAVNLALRRYLLPIMAHLMSKPQLSRMYVMINAAGPEFNELYETLRVHGDDRAFDLDQTGMDLHNQVFWEKIAWIFGEMAQRMGYTSGQVRVVRRCVLIMKAVILKMSDNIYYSWAFLSSGCCFTSVFNSLCGELLLASIFYDKNPGVSVGTFGKWFQTAHVGDDVVATVSPLCNFSPEEFRLAALDWGYEVTSGSKTKEIKLQSILELTFLRRRFVKMHGRVVGQLAAQSIYKSLAYCTGIKAGDVENERSRNLMTLYSGMRESVYHSREMYDELLGIGRVFFPNEKFVSYDRLVTEMMYCESTTWNNYAHGDKLLSSENASLQEDMTLLGEGAHEYSRRGRGQPNCLVDWQVPRHLKHATEHQQQHTTSSPSTMSLNPSSATEVMESSDAVVKFASSSPSITTVPPGRSVIVRTQPQSQLELSSYFERFRLFSTTLTTLVSATHWEVFNSWKTMPTVNAFLSKWSLFRGDLMVKVVVTGSTQVVGKWRLSFYPYRHVDAYSTAVDRPAYGGNYYSVTSVLPHIDIDLSTVGTYYITLPYPSQFPMMYVDSSDSDYIMSLAPINPVISISGGTAPAIPIEVWVAYKNVVMDVLTYQGGDDQTGVVSSTARYASKLASSAPFPWASAASRVLALGADVAEFLGYSKPYSEPTTAMVRREVGNFSVMSGQPDFAYTVGGADPRCGTSVDTSIIPLSQRGETSINTIIRRWGQVSRSVSSGFEFRSNPLQYMPITVGPDLHAMFTPLAYVSRLFTYYTGSVDYCVEVVSSPLIRWRLGIAIFAPGVIPSATFPDNGSVLTHIVDIVGTTCFEFSVPYMYRQDFYPLDGNGGSVHPTIKFYSLMSPNGPSETPVYPYINLYWRAGSDFELAIPTLENTITFRSLGGETEDWILQGTGPKSRAIFGEAIDDVVELTHRKSLYAKVDYGAYAILLGKPIPPLADHDGLITQGAMSYSNFWTYSSWLAPMFLGENGSYDWAVGDIHPSGVNVCCDVAFEPSAVWQAQSANGRGVQFIPNTSATEFRLPNRCPNSFRTTSKVEYGDFPTQVLAFSIERDYNGLPPLWFFSGTGDDFVLGGFLAPPVLHINT